MCPSTFIGLKQTNHSKNQRYTLLLKEIIDSFPWRYQLLFRLFILNPAPNLPYSDKLSQLPTSHFVAQTVHSKSIPGIKLQLPVHFTHKSMLYFNYLVPGAGQGNPQTSGRLFSWKLCSELWSGCIPLNIGFVFQPSGL